MEHHSTSAPLGPVAIDIGAGTGALVIHTDADQLGREIEISPVQDRARRQHVAVLERRTPSRSRYAAVFGSLQEGEYAVDVGATKDRITVVAIRGGEITELDWRASPPVSEDSQAGG